MEEGATSEGLAAVSLQLGRWVDDVSRPLRPLARRYPKIHPYYGEKAAVVAPGEEEAAVAMEDGGGGSGGGAAASGDRGKKKQADGQPEEGVLEVGAAENGGGSGGVGSAAAAGRVPHWYMFLLALHWLSNISESVFILVLVLPLQCEDIAGPDLKGTYLGTVTTCASLVTVPIGPLSGLFTDRFVTRWGRRKPAVVIMTVLTTFFIMALYPVATTATAARVHDDFALWLPLMVLYVIVASMKKITDAAASTPYQSMLPDLIPMSQFGMMSGYFGLMSLVGTLLGIGLFGLVLEYMGMFWALLADCVMLYMTLLVLVMFQEKIRSRRSFLPHHNGKHPPEEGGGAEAEAEVEVEEGAREGEGPELSGRRLREALRGLWTVVLDMLEPFRKNRNFRWAFACRFLVQFGFGMVMVVALYYMREVIESPYSLFGLWETESSQLAFVVQQVPAVLCAGVWALFAGKVSDYVPKNYVAMTGGIIQAFAVVVLVLCTKYWQSFLLGLVGGMGLGIFSSAEFSLLNETIPSVKDSGRYMGVWHLSLNLPGIVASATAGVIADFFNKKDDILQVVTIPFLGYRLVLLIAGCVMLLGGACAAFVRKVPRVDEEDVDDGDDDDDDDDDHDSDSDSDDDRDSHEKAAVELDIL